MTIQSDIVVLLKASKGKRLWSLTELGELAGIERNGVCLAVTELVEGGLLVKDGERYRLP